MITMSKPLVSIITPCYNGEAYLDRYFNSILKQTYRPLELIFVNDGSADRTAELAEHYRPLLEQSDIRFVSLHQENAGQAAALNRGLKHFTGQYLTWTDADDEMTPDCIEKKVTFLQAHPEVEMVRSDGFYVDPHNNKKDTIAKTEDKCTQDIFEKLLLVHTYGCNGCYMITRDLLLACYPDRDIFQSRAGQNWQLLVPAASRSRCGYIDECLYLIYEHSDSHSRQERSVNQMYERWDMFTEILRHAIDASECETETYIRLVEANKARQKFYYAVSVRDREMLKKAIKELRTHGRVTTKEWLLYVKCILRG